jgi:hypothetical protein
MVMEWMESLGMGAIGRWLIVAVVEVQQFSGGSFPRSGPCEAFAQHGFYGFEDQVVTAAANWIVAH